MIRVYPVSVVAVLGVLTSSSAAYAGATCGLSGPLAERLAQCETALGEQATRKAKAWSDRSGQLRAEEFTWRLAGRGADGAELWYDESGNRVWSESAPAKLTRQQAIDFCASDQGPGARWQWPASFRLPEIEDFIELSRRENLLGNRHGIANILPGLAVGTVLWTKTVPADGVFGGVPITVRVSKSYDNEVGDLDLDLDFALGDAVLEARCVAEAQ